MKSASTSARTEAILYDVVNGSRAKPVAYLQWWDGSAWQYFDDVESFNLSQSNQDNRYGKFVRVPPSHTLSATFDNKDGKYSPGNGGEYDGVLVRNRKVRALVGYALNSAVSQTYAFGVGQYETLYHTQVIGSKVYNSIASAASNPTYSGVTDTLTFYDDLLYGGGTYSAEGYYASDILDFAVFDTEVLKTLSITSDTDSVNNLSSYLSHRWALNETSGTVVYDTGTSPVNGTNSGATVNQSGVRGTSYYFDGTKKITAGTSISDIDYNKSFSLSVWVKTSKTSGHNLLVTKRYGGVGFYFSVYNNTDVLLEMCSSVANYTTFTAKASLADGNWHHIGIVHSGSGTPSIYIDGVIFTTLVFYSSGTLSGSISNAGTLTFGEDSPEQTSGSFPLVGNLDDIRIYNKALTASEVLSVYRESSIKIYARSSSIKANLTGNVVPFTKLGELVNGTSTFTLADITDRYFQFAVVFATGTWSTSSGYFENVTIGYTQTTELFNQGEFYLDAPRFSSASGAYKASCSGRDVLKKAFETSVSCPKYDVTTYPSGVDCAVIIRNIADRAGIPHDDGSELIPTTGYTVTIANDDNFQNIKAIDALNEVMEYLTAKDATYRLQLTDGYLELVQVSTTDTEADWTVDYRYTMTSLDREELTDKLIQRVTVLSKDHTVDPEKSIATASHTTTQTNVDLSWTNDAMYIRIVTSGGTFTLNYVDLAAKKINYSSTGTISITVYGDELRAGFTGYFGESINQTNAASQEGFTHKIVNRLVQSDADAKAMAESFVSEYGAPAWQVSCTIWCNPLVEIGDRILVWERYTNVKTIYRVNGFSISYNANGAALFQTLDLDDLGINGIDPFIWDANGATEGTGDIDYDKGLVWDMDLGPTGTDTTDYSTYKPVTFS